MALSKNFKIILLFTPAMLAIVGYWIFFKPNTSNQTIKLKIYSTQAPASNDEIISRMQLQNDVTFKLAASILQLKTFRPGLYELKSGMSNFKIIRRLRNGSQTPVKFVLNNIQTKEDLAGKIGSYLEVDSFHAIQKLNDPAFCAQYGFTTETILTMFLPNTHEMYWNIPLDEFMIKMQKEHQKFWNSMRLQQADKLGLNKVETYIIASLVQKEYARKSERSTIAGVIINRLRKGMALQIDATCKYATGDFAAKRVNSTHINFDSPYNTYKYKGLPPGPICMPELSTIDAVLQATAHNYLYYCAKPDLSGYHEFSSSFQNHVSTAKQYRNKLDQKGIH